MINNTYDVHFSVNITKISSINMTLEISFNCMFIITWRGMLVFTTNITPCKKMANILVYIWPEYSVLALALHLLIPNVQCVDIGDILLVKSLE